MVFHYDEKGKFFTDFIAKTQVNVTIQTVIHRVRGRVYIRHGERFRDEINKEDVFIAVTDAEIFDANGQVLYVCDFLAVHRDQIVWMWPEEDPTLPPAEAGGDA